MQTANFNTTCFAGARGMFLCGGLAALCVREARCCLALCASGAWHRLCNVQVNNLSPAHNFRPDRK